MKDTIAAPAVYRQNIDFWQRAWSMVKVPYTQMPALDYIPRIPAAIESQKSSPVLDLGCGSGWLSIFLARNGFQVTAVDVADQALNLGKTWAEEENLHIEFKKQDISDLEFPSGHFGSVVANSIFEHLTFELASKTVADLKRLLKPGGIFLGCFDRVGTGPGEFYRLEDGTHVYTDKGRRGMMLRCFSDEDIKNIFQGWKIIEFVPVSDLTRMLIAEVA